MIAVLTEDQRQVVILALVELKQRRPGWGDYLDVLVDDVLAGRQMRLELERLHGQVDRLCRTAGLTPDGLARFLAPDEGRTTGDDR